MLEQKITHVYQEFGGKHDWPYCRKNIFKTLIFFNQQL